MLYVIFTYNRLEMLSDEVEHILDHIGSHDQILIIDDGSEWSQISYPVLFDSIKSPRVQLIRTEHTGKKGFWKKWMVATQIALGTNHQNFVFLPDDVKDFDFETIRDIASQGWRDIYYCLNLSNEGVRYRWGAWDSNQPDITINGITFQECGFVDGLFITNRKTLEKIEVTQVPDSWFDRPDKSSGVGYYMSMDLRTKGVKMMIPDSSLVMHGDHESQMHKEHRKQVPLISKRKF